MRIVAIIATYNEERFIGGCLDHLHSQGIDTYLCDNSSTDRTAAIATERLGAGVCGIEHIPRDGTFRWRSILARKEALAAELDADWFLHLDADEIPLPPRSYGTLAEAIGAVDAGGFDAVQFAEFTFVPTREAPNHDHPHFRQTMRWYYPFAPTPLHLVRGWKRQPGRVDLVSTGGHNVGFSGRRLFPEYFRLRHYLFLSRQHAWRKYVSKTFDPNEVRDGWHGWRAALQPDEVQLPSQAELRLTLSDDDLDSSSPRSQHCICWGQT